MLTVSLLTFLMKVNEESIEESNLEHTLLFICWLQLTSKYSLAIIIYLIRLSFTLVPYIIWITIVQLVYSFIVEINVVAY